MQTVGILLLAIGLCAAQICDDSEYFNGQHCAPCQENCQCSSENACSSCLPGYTFDSTFTNCVECPNSVDSVNVGCE